MNGATQEISEAVTAPESAFRQTLRYGFHVLAVYALVNFTTLGLAGFTYARVLPLIQQHRPTASPFEFGFSHLFLFSFYPAIAIAFLYAHWFRHKVAYFVWLVPLAILAYQFIVFPFHASVLIGGSSRFAEAFHHFFAGNFVIEEYHSYRELFDIAGSNPDMRRGLDQYYYVAPLYAAIGYGIGTLLGIKMSNPKLHSALKSMKPSLLSGNSRRERGVSLK